MKNKKADISLETIVKAVIALFVIVVVIWVGYLIIKNAFFNTTNATECEGGQEGKCKDSCSSGETRSPLPLGCKDGKVCCIKNT